VRERQKSNLPIYKFAQQWRRRQHDVWEKEEEVEVLLNCFAAAALGIRSRARTQPANCQRKTIFPTLYVSILVKVRPIQYHGSNSHRRRST